jgi:hypothetical protein
MVLVSGEGFPDGSVGESTDYPIKYGYHFSYFPLDTSRGGAG